MNTNLPSPPEDPMAAISDNVMTLGLSLALWAERDDESRRGSARDAAMKAISAVDVLIVQLHRLRDPLFREVRRFDRENRPYDDRD